VENEEASNSTAGSELMENDEKIEVKTSKSRINV